MVICHPKASQSVSQSAVSSRSYRTPPIAGSPFHRFMPCGGRGESSFHVPAKLGSCADRESPLQQRLKLTLSQQVSSEYW